jgi:tRNA pseudouridine55 synthase
MTSHDVVARIRRVARTRRVGHAGTLDPMATGVLVIGVGRATRLLPYAAGHSKAYRGTVRLGQTTITDDAEGEVTGCANAGRLTDQEIARALDAFRGEITQVPSAVSAIKVKGVRSYARVRRGEEVALAARPITVHRLDLLAVHRDPEVADDGVDTVDVEIELECSPGTYVRALARDLGATLDVGGHLVALRRTAVGGFAVDQAVPLAALIDADPPASIAAHIMSLEAVAARLFHRRDADEEQARVLSHGGPLSGQGRSGPYAVFGPDGRVVAVVAERDGLARAEVVLSPAGPVAPEADASGAGSVAWGE